MKGRATCWGAAAALVLLFLLPALLLVATLGYCGVPSEGVRLARSTASRLSRRFYAFLSGHLSCHHYKAGTLYLTGYIGEV